MSNSKNKLLHEFSQTAANLQCNRHITVTWMKTTCSFPLYLDDIIHTNPKKKIKFNKKLELIICLLRHSEVNEYRILAKSQMSNKQF